MPLRNGGPDRDDLLRKHGMRDRVELVRYPPRGHRALNGCCDSVARTHDR